MCKSLSELIDDIFTLTFFIVNINIKKHEIYLPTPAYLFVHICNSACKIKQK